MLVPAGDPLALAEALRRLALDARARERMALAARERAERFAWPHVAAEVLDCYEQAVAVADRTRRAAARSVARAALRHGFAPADLLPRVPAQRLPSLAPELRRRSSAASAACARCAAPAPSRCSARRRARSPRVALQRVGVTRVLASLLASKPGLVLAGLALMCAAMFVARALLARDPRRRADLARAQNAATRCRARSSAC